MKTLNISGIVAYPITPFSTITDTVDIVRLRDVIDDLLESKADAIAALGSAGEGAYLEDKEWELVAKETVAHVSGKVPVIIGISELTSKKAIDRAIFAEEHGADAIMVSPLSYYKLSEVEIFEHYAAIASAITIPIMVYNNPATCGVDLSPEFMLHMVDKINNVTMIKESTGDIQRMHQLHSLSNGEVPFFNGCNYIALEALNAGAKGWCTAAPILIDELPKKLFDAVAEGDAKVAQKLFYQQLPLLEFIVNGGLAATVKAGLELKQKPAGLARRPLKDIPEEKKLVLKEILNKIKNYN